MTRIFSVQIITEEGRVIKGLCNSPASQRIVYEKIELIRPDRRAELLADLEARTGLKIKRVAIGKIDFLRDVVNLRVIYDKPPQGDGMPNVEVEEPSFETG